MVICADLAAKCADLRRNTNGTPAVNRKGRNGRDGQTPLRAGKTVGSSTTHTDGCYPVTPYAKWGKSGCWLLAGTKINSNPNSKDNYHSYR